MGSYVELNDTLQITRAQGFPRELSLERHLKRPYAAAQFRGRVFSFKNKPGARIYHVAPTPCHLVENREGKWLYWGKVHVIEQTIHAGKRPTTSGKFKIVAVYEPRYQELLTRNHTDKGKSWF